jgi:hypothetical protein
MKYLKTFEQFVNEKYEYVNEAKEFVVTAAERISKKGELTDNQQADFDHNVQAATTNLETAIPFIKELENWKASSKLEEDLKSNYLEFSKTWATAKQHYLKSYKAAEKGNVRQAEKFMEMYRKLEKTFNDYYKKGIKIKEAAGLKPNEANPWEKDIKTGLYGDTTLGGNAGRN